MHESSAADVREPGMSGEALRACDLGATPYREGLAVQEALVRLRAAGLTGDWVLFAEHPPVLTVGRSADPSSLRASPERLRALGLELFEVARGGDVTWHGPGQLVGYPIVELSRRGRDVHRYLRDLEGTLIDALATWGIEGRTVTGRTGVWSGEDKLASIGVAVRRWVGYHGFALNVAPDLSHFDLIHPCGLRGIHMTSMAEQLGDACPSLAAVRARVAAALAARLDAPGLVWEPLETLRALLATESVPAASGSTRAA